MKAKYYAITMNAWKDHVIDDITKCCTTYTTEYFFEKTWPENKLAKYSGCLPIRRAGKTICLVLR